MLYPSCGTIDFNTRQDNVSFTLTYYIQRFSEVHFIMYTILTNRILAVGNHSTHLIVEVGTQHACG